MYEHIFGRKVEVEQWRCCVVSAVILELGQLLWKGNRDPHNIKGHSPILISSTSFQHFVFSTTHFDMILSVECVDRLFEAVLEDRSIIPELVRSTLNCVEPSLMFVRTRYKSGEPRL